MPNDFENSSLSVTKADLQCDPSCQDLSAVVDVASRGRGYLRTGETPSRLSSVLFPHDGHIQEILGFCMKANYIFVAD